MHLGASPSLILVGNLSTLTHLHIGPGCSLVINLGSEVILQHSKGIDFIFNDKRLLIMEVEGSVAGKRGGLVEQVQVADSKLLGHRLVHI